MMISINLKGTNIKSNNIFLWFGKKVKVFLGCFSFLQPKGNLHTFLCGIMSEREQEIEWL